MVAPRMVARRSGMSKSSKEEIEVLREEALELTQELVRLQHKRREEIGQGDPWKRRAFEQSAERLKAIQENEKLRAAFADCKMLSSSLMQLMNRMDPCRRNLGTVEETEWKLNVLGSNPHRRHYNADKIMRSLLCKIPSWCINNGLVDVVKDTHHNYCDQRAREDEPVRVEVVMSRVLKGHYVDVAGAVWRTYMQQDIETSTAASVHAMAPEILGDGIRHIVSGIRMYMNGSVVEHNIHHLCQRVQDESRVVIMWKTVFERLDVKTAQFTDHSDGWVSFEKAGDSNTDSELCIMKYSGMTQVMPIDHSDHRRGQGLVQLLRMMNLSSGLDVSTDTEAPWADSVERARRVFAEFLIETLWRHAKQIEGAAYRYHERGDQSQSFR